MLLREPARMGGLDIGGALAIEASRFGFAKSIAELQRAMAHSIGFRAAGVVFAFVIETCAKPLMFDGVCRAVRQARLAITARFNTSPDLEGQWIDKDIFGSPSFILE
jgi:hypothetical protein